MVGSKVKKSKYESFDQKRRRIMSELGTKITELNGSQKQYDEAVANLGDWTDRFEVIDGKTRVNPSQNLLFLREQAKINKQLAQEAHDREKHLYERTIEVRKQATEALAQLDRITLSSATQQKAKTNRNIRLNGSTVTSVESLDKETQRDLDHAEYYIQALTELTLEK